MVKRKVSRQQEQDHHADTFSSVMKAADALFGNRCSIASLHAPDIQSFSYQQTANLEAIAAMHSYHLYIYSASSFGTTLQWSAHDTKKGVSDISSYRALCNKINQLKRIVIVIYEAEVLSKDVLSILARLHSYAKRNQFRYKLLLIGDTHKFRGFMSVGLKVQETFFCQPDSAAVDPRQAKYLSMNVALFALSFLLAGYFIFNAIKPSNEATPVAQEYPQEELESPEIANEIAQSIDVASKPAKSTKAATQDINDSNLAIVHDEKAQEARESKTQISTEARQQAITSLVDNEAREKKRVTTPYPKMSEQMTAAIKRRDFKLIEKLFRGGEPLNAVNQEGENLLLIAAWLSDEEMLKSAINLGVPLNQVDKKGRSALFYTAIEGDDLLTELLLTAGVEVNLTSHINKTALMAAVRNSHYGLTQLLLEHRADIDTQDHSGWSALFYAAWNNDATLVQRLLQAGANSKLRDNDDYTAADIAELRGYPQLAEQISRF